MKKAFISLLALTLFASYGHAQEKSPRKSTSFFLRVGGGYALSQSGQSTVDGVYLDGSSSYSPSYSGQQLQFESETFDIKKGSFGTGLKAVVAGGVMLHKNLGLELAVGIGIGSKKYTYDYARNESGSSPTYTYKTTYKGTMYQKNAIHLMPSVILQTGGEKVNVYSRIGVALPVSGKLISERAYTMSSSNNPTTNGQEEVYEIKTRFTVGMQGALGVQLFIGQKAGFFVEANGVSMTADAKSAKLTKAMSNGTDYLPLLDVSTKNIEYEKSGTITSASDPGQPSKAATFSIPYSNIGFGLGLVFYL